MAVALKIGVFYLVSEFLTHTFRIFVFLDAARAVPALALQAFFYRSDYLLVRVELYLSAHNRYHTFRITCCNAIIIP